MTKILTLLHDFVWGAPALALILGVGIYLGARTGWVQIILLPEALRSFFGALRSGYTDDGVSGFQALCTALAATVGTGNLVGVAGAICIGGPGSIFWMWVCGFLGMATKYAEAVLAVRYREKIGNEFVGGPMYMISRGMGDKWRWLAAAYALFGTVAAFGVGNATQINAVVTGVNGVLRRFGSRESLMGNLLMGLLLAVMVGGMLWGGAKRIGQTAERLVPFASAAYLLLCVWVLAVKLPEIPGAFAAILTGAFSPKAVTGGAIGAAFSALQVGCARGVFTNEAGMGTASIAHAGADVKHPVQQGLMGIMEVFLDTIVICTMTALVILCSGVPVPYGLDAGGELTMAAFSTVCGDGVSLLLAAMLSCFAFATVLGWGLYGARCTQYLFGSYGWKCFVLLQTVAVIPGALMRTDLIWSVTETVNGLMAIPNLIALAVLCPEVRRLTIDYKQKTGSRPVEVHYADFYQRKPL